MVAKKLSLLLVLFFGTAIGMEPAPYPQLQLAEQKEKPRTIAHLHLADKGYLYFSTTPILRGNHSVHFEGKPYRYLNDPFAVATLTFPNSRRPAILAPIPVKHLLYLNNESELQFTIKTRKDQEDIHAICKNWQRYTTFQESLQVKLNEFYKKPITYPTPDIFIEKDIIRLSKNERRVPIGALIFQGVTEKHSPVNGCPNEEAIIKSLIKPRIKNHNQSAFQYIRDRQIGKSNNLRSSKSIKK